MRIALVFATLTPVMIPLLAQCGGAQSGEAANPPRFHLAAPPLAVGPMATRPILADLDGDGDLDVVVVCGPCCGRDACEESGHVRILRNDGKGVLSLAGDRIRLGPTALGADVGDIDGDGHLDIAVHHHQSYRVGLLRGREGLSFWPPTYVTLHDGTRPHVHSLRLGDVNNDGKLDLLATLVDDHAMAVLLGDGSGGFTPTPGQPFFAHRHPYTQLNVADLNHDGHLDATMTDMRGGGLTVLIGSGTGMFSPRNGFSLDTTMPIASAERPMACALGDLDGDGNLDAVAFIDESPKAVVMRNTGSGHFVEIGEPLVDLGIPSVGGKLADVDGDGRLDIVASGTMVRSVSVCLGQPGMGFGPPVVVDAGGFSPHAAVADMNGDGRADIVTGNYDGTRIYGGDGPLPQGTVSVLLGTNAR